MQRVLGLINEREVVVQEPPDNADKDLKDINDKIQNSLLVGFAHVMPFVMEGLRMKNAVDRSSERFKTKSLKIVGEEADLCKEEVLTALGYGAEVSAVSHDLKDSWMPSAALLFAAYTAPGQVRIKHVFNLVGSIMSCVLAVLSLISAPMMFVRPCYEGTVMQHRLCAWFAIDGAWSIVDAMKGLIVYRRSSRLVEGLVVPPPIDHVGDSLEALRKLAEHHSTNGAKALEGLDSLGSSGTSIFSFICSFLLAIVGADFAFNTGMDDCPGLGLVPLLVLRLRVFLYLMLALPMVCLLPLLAPGIVAGAGPGPLLSIATNLDETLQLGFPLFTLLVESLVIRNRKDFFEILTAQAQEKADGIERRRYAVEVALAKQKTEEEAVNAKLEGFYQEKEAAKLAMSPEDAALLAERQKAEEEIHHSANAVVKSANSAAAGVVGPKIEALPAYVQSAVGVAAQGLQAAKVGWDKAGEEAVAELKAARAEAAVAAAAAAAAAASSATKSATAASSKDGAAAGSAADVDKAAPKKRKSEGGGE
jgi:hypothetical protein